ncbi:uncharacterized protein EV422DRAFT_571526 [Fimicolochytrium jonesii]|uniref:uncharacterized protein n=1 Tax=Fimicolochytrium jonesii TaxID=1396493 RepID=UPI0022FDB755|nr:uncharacterized protein EV422DRAFT_571526 [Fimicolochytrium jonesii]KAI8816773.1 hypothetical protein EV422DRAFT_571526 [Fimicolochytrium jonesii]
MRDSELGEMVMVFEDDDVATQKDEVHGTDVSVFVNGDLDDDDARSDTTVPSHPPAVTVAKGALDMLTGRDIILPADACFMSHHDHRPLLDPRIARVVSSVSSACRISLRTASILVEIIFESLKFSATTSLSFTRRALVAAVSSARTVHLIAMGKGRKDSLSFFKVLDKYTSAGVYVIHNVFSLAELLTHTTFHLASSTIQFSLEAAEECVQVLDGLFGETETSKALAAFICLVKKELRGHEDDLFISQGRCGRLSALGQITKALTAYCCLQYVNRKRWRQSLKLTPIFEGHVRVAELEELPAPDIPRQITDGSEQRKKADDMSYTDLLSLALQNPDHQLTSMPLNRARLLNAMERRRMSNPERCSTLPIRLSDIDGAEPRRALLQDLVGLNGNVAAYGELSDADNFERTEDHRHSPLTFDGRRTRTKSGQNIPYRLQPEQVSNVLQMLETVQSTSREKHAHKWERHYSECKTMKHKLRPHSLVQSTAPLLLRPPSPRQKLFEKITRYVRFASGAYGTNFLKILGIGRARDFLLEHSTDHHNHQSFAFHTDVPVEHILTSSFRDPTVLHPPSLIAPVHYLVVDAKTSAVVVSLRGTLGLSDLITDLTSSYSAYTTFDGHPGKVHSGMLASAEKIARGPVRKAVCEALIKHPGFSLVLTGHSLGGGVAALLALLWSRKSLDNNGEHVFVTSDSSGFPERQVHCFVYGSPAVMSLDLSNHYKHLITSIIYRHDIVPCLSLGLLRDFRNVAVNLCQEQGMAERVIGNVLGVFKKYPSATPPEEANHEDDLWYWALLKTLRADMCAEKLYPPGSVYWIDATTPAVTAASFSDLHGPPSPSAAPAADSSKPPKKATALTVHEVDDVETAFSEFTFSRTMFLDHSPYSYERACGALTAAMKTQEWE